MRVQRTEKENRNVRLDVRKGTRKIPPLDCALGPHRPRDSGGGLGLPMSWQAPAELAGCCGAVDSGK